MTNDELNRKVATLRGLTQCQCEPNCGFWYTAAEEQTLLPNYCDDPAAWGGLFVELGNEGYAPFLDTRNGMVLSARFKAIVIDDRQTYIGIADSPGRALCLAYIVSQEGRG